MKIVDIVYWILNAFILASIIFGYVVRCKTRKIFKTLEENNSKRWKAYDDFVTNYGERLNLLSRENNKLRSENEELKERLRDLGIKDFDVM